MNPLNPDTIPQVDMDFMNADHREAVTMVNDLLAAIAETDADKVTSLFQAFIQHNTEHFGREEAEMIKCNFPPYDCHKGEHERVLAELHEMQSQWQASQDFNLLQTYLSDTVVNWFLNHLNTMDTVTAGFIRRHQVA